MERAWAQGARRVWVHTCSLDGPHALANYTARGFRVYDQRVDLRRPAPRRPGRGRTPGACRNGYRMRRAQRSFGSGVVDMEQRPLGSTGLRVSALGFGCGAVGGLMVRGTPADQRQAVSRALDAGITYFDTAAQYGDGALGREPGPRDARARHLAARGRGHEGAAAAGRAGRAAPAVRESLEASLRRLGRPTWTCSICTIPWGWRAPTAACSTSRRCWARSRTALAGSQAGGTGAARRLHRAGRQHAVREVVKSEPFETVQAYFNVLNPSAGLRRAHGRPAGLRGPDRHGGAGWLRGDRDPRAGRGRGDRRGRARG